MVLPSCPIPVNVREMESPLDVLSRAASLIQQEEARNKIDGEKDGSSDSGFEDNPSPPSKVSIHEERRDARMRERQSLTSALNKNEEKESTEKTKDQEERRSPVYLAMKENTALVRNKTRVLEPVEKSDDKNENRPKITEGHSMYSGKAVSTNEHIHKPSARSGSPWENETRESVIKTSVTASGFSKFTASSVKPVGHYGFPYLSPFGSALPMLSRPSVITTAGCPSVFKGPNFPFCQCMSTCCPDVKPAFPERHSHGRELRSAIPTGFESPTVDDHFKKSLGPVYDRLSPGGHHYEVKTPSPHIQPRNTTFQDTFQDTPKQMLSPSLSRHVDLADHKNDILHPHKVKSEREFHDYAPSSFHKRRYIHYDPVAHYTPERLHGFVSPMQQYEKPGLTKEHLFMPHPVEEPGSVDDHFAKALGKLWFDVQLRNSEQVMRFHSKSLRVAHQ